MEKSTNPTFDSRNNVTWTITGEELFMKFGDKNKVNIDEEDNMTSTLIIHRETTPSLFPSPSLLDNDIRKKIETKLRTKYASYSETQIPGHRATGQDPRENGLGLHETLEYSQLGTT
ncbi:MAG: hypothetical protein ACFFDI_14425 [Promethearchaeota archaeon]